ncbi:alpha-galactosidase [Aeromonas diversa CDC 2478-85]|uniref:Alpha-galactosidase n=1 Tax=Aeromonas diversa CDC 2478-85 TaxID=1268237 RepID=N9VKY7_9GAMM|nr:glycoside hydrolase family 36 protein [Aeromonas diversa]ENY72258.1 alpha-galactosidase [Aeromonas diversa CDC 2478-85]
MGHFLSSLRQSAVTQLPLPGLLVTHQWQERECRIRLDNVGGSQVCPDYWSLFDGQFGLAEAPIYGEGFQMLAQTLGTWSAPEAVGRCPDAGDYRITRDQGFHTVHNLLLVQTQAGWLLLAFGSCHRFGGEFRLYPDGRLQILMRTEGRALMPGQYWLSESLICLEGSDRGALLSELGQRLAREHGGRAGRRPSGWCSWYHYYAEVSEADIRENLAQMGTRFTDLEYVQIDDGYQAFMGDWLDPSERFAGGVPALVEEIQAAHRKPALWVAPFIAEPGSALFRDHPDWFVKDEQGRPLAAELVTYGGWRCTPWYVLDGTHPEVQRHLASLFRILRAQWGIDYFKLDANFWGAIHGGHFHDPLATRIEAYRRGMAAVRRGAGEDAFLLGCNAPIWPSVGLVDGMRVGDDVERKGTRIRQIARELFCRAWQGEHLWALDPDCVCLRDIPGQQASAQEYAFHLAAMVASGGMMLAGDRLQDLDEGQAAALRQLLVLCQGHSSPARFDDLGFSQGEIMWQGQILRCLFNWSSEPREIMLPAGAVDFWDHRPLGERLILAPSDGRVVCYSLR